MNKRLWITLALLCASLQTVCQDVTQESQTAEVLVGIYDSKTGSISLPEGTVGMKWVFSYPDNYLPVFNLVDESNQALDCGIVMLDGENGFQNCYFKAQEDDCAYLIIATGQAAQNIADLRQRMASCDHEQKTEVVGGLHITLNRTAEKLECCSSGQSLGLWHVATHADGLECSFTDFDNNPLDCDICLIEENSDACTLIAHHTAAMKAALVKKLAEKK